MNIDETLEQGDSLNQFLTFCLGDEQYALNVRNVQSVLEVTPTTKLPQTPEYMRGVINLRGSVIPVIDFRLKFGLPTAEKTVNTRIIVMELEYESSTVTVGAIADSVQEVINLDPENIDPAPKIGTNINTDFISGIGKINEDFLILLDLQKIFQENEIETLKESKRLASKEKVPVSG